MKYEMTGMTRKNKREENQDAFQYCYFHIEDEDAVLLVAADGMGGMENGAVISRTALWTFQSVFFQCLNDQILKNFNEDDTIEERLMECLEKSMENTQQTILAYLQQENVVGGTTLTAALLVGRKVFIINVGDSPCYFYRKGNANLYLLSKIENKGYVGLERGIYPSIDSAEFQRATSYLLNYIGCPRYKVPAVTVHSVSPGDMLFIGTDGAFGTMGVQELYTLVDPDSLNETIFNIINLAKDNGETDNQTMIVCKVTGE